MRAVIYWVPESLASYWVRDVSSSAMSISCCSGFDRSCRFAIMTVIVRMFSTTVVFYVLLFN